MSAKKSMRQSRPNVRLLLPILPNYQDCQDSDFAGSEIYAHFEKLNLEAIDRLCDEGVDGKNGDNEAEYMVTRSVNGRPLFKSSLPIFN